MRFDLVNYILKKKGLYEEGEEPVGDGTPSDEKKGEGEEGIEPAGADSPASNAVTELMNVFNGKKKSKKKPLREGKKPCNECDDMGTGGSNAAKDVVMPEENEKDTGPEPTDKAVEALKDWFNMSEEDSAISNEEEPKGLTDAEAKDRNSSTDEELAKQGDSNSPPAEIKEAVRTLRKMAKRLREEAEDDEKAAEGMEDEAEKLEGEAEKKEAVAEVEEKKDELKEWAIKLRKKSRRLREEAEDAVEKADALADKAEDVAKAEEPEEEKEEDEKAEEEAVTEWTRNIAATGRKMIRENRAKKIASKLVKLMEDEEVGMGTPGGVDLNSDFGDANDDGTAKRAAVAAPTTEEEAGEDELPD